MATRGFGSYDDPNFRVRREAFQRTAAGNGGVMTFRSYQAIRMKAIHGFVLVAGTSNSPGHALTVKQGTTSIGLLALGTNTAGVSTSLPLNVTGTAGEQFSVTNGTDATGTAEVIWEYEVLPDAVVTV